MTFDTRNHSTKKALILGHSFVRRLKEFVIRDTKHQFCDTLNIADACSVAWHGIGGRTIEKINLFDRAIISSIKPDILLLEIGSNDLCPVYSKPKTVASDILQFVKSYHDDLHVKIIIVCQICKRSKSPHAKYNDNVSAANNYLKLALSKTEYAIFWRHRGLSNPTGNIFARDGIHLNGLGNKALYKSYRGAILMGVKKFNDLNATVT